MGTGPVVCFVAGCAVGGVCRAGPGHGLTIGGVARTAGQGYPMIAGIVPRCMDESYGRRPCRDGVADIALLGGDEVRCILPGGAGAIVAV